MEKLFQIKKTQIEMLQDRGYDVSRELPILDMTVAVFIQLYSDYTTTNRVSIREALRQIYQSPTGSSILVYYLESQDGKKIGTELANIFLTYLKASNVRHVILITDTALGSHAQDQFKNLPLYRIEHFLETEMMYNPKKHFLVPRHELMTEEEAKEFYETNRFKPSQLPNMFVTDRMARYYGAIPGQTFRIHQKSMVNDSMIDNSISYRYVTATPPVSKKK